MFCANGGLQTVPESTENAPVKYLGLRGNFINSIAAEDFTVYTSLKRLDLQYNSIATIPYGTFESLGKVNELYLVNNRISRLKNQTFTGLTSLHYLVLSNNRMFWQERFLRRGVCKTLTTLQTLSLSHNSISEIDSGVFAGLSRLTSLKLNGNFISAIGAHFLSNSLHVVEIDLSHNQISTVNEYAFENVPALNILKLNDNKLTYLSPDVFSTAAQLSSLKLNDNPWQVCHVASRDLCDGIVTKDETSFPPDPQAMILYFSVRNTEALIGILVVVVSVIIYKNNKKRSTESVMYCQNTNDTCTVCAGFPSDYNCGHHSNSSRTGTYQANETDAIDLTQTL
ncbi:TRIL protein, partial [Polyodon spathula]|nr:TRIL protein [Polyodon spathula]